MAVKQGLIEKSGAWYAYKGEKIGQGKKNVALYLEENLNIANEIENIIRKELLGDNSDSRKEDEKEAIAASDDVVVLADAKAAS